MATVKETIRDMEVFMVYNDVGKHKEKLRSAITHLEKYQEVIDAVGNLIDWIHIEIHNRRQYANIGKKLILGKLVRIKDLFHN